MKRRRRSKNKSWASHENPIEIHSRCSFALKSRHTQTFRHKKKEDWFRPLSISFKHSLQTRKNKVNDERNHMKRDERKKMMLKWSESTYTHTKLLTNGIQTHWNRFRMTIASAVRSTLFFSANLRVSDVHLLFDWCNNILWFMQITTCSHYARLREVILFHFNVCYFFPFFVYSTITESEWVRQKAANGSNCRSRKARQEMS